MLFTFDSVLSLLSLDYYYLLSLDLPPSSLSSIIIYGSMAYKMKHVLFLSISPTPTTESNTVNGAQQMSFFYNRLNG